MEKIEQQSGNSRREVMDLYNSLHDAMSYMTLQSAGLVIGSSNAAKVKTASTFVYKFDGVLLSKTSAEVAFTATTHDIPASAATVQERVYLICINGSGTLSIVAGEIATGSKNAAFPEKPADLTVVGAVRIAVAAGSTDFDATTDELSESHLTVHYTNLTGPYIGLFDSEKTFEFSSESPSESPSVSESPSTSPSSSESPSESPSPSPS